MPENIFIDIKGEGQYLPIPPAGAVIVYDRGSAYGTNYKLNCLTGELTYTPGSSDGFRFIVAQANVFGGGGAPTHRQDNAVWGPLESFSSNITLSNDLGQGLRNTAYITGSPVANTPVYKDYTYSNGTTTYKSLWYYLRDFNKQWSIFKNWFIPSKQELSAIVQKSVAGETFGFLKSGWVHGSNEASATAAVSALLMDGSEGSGAEKNSVTYGRFYCMYLGGEGFPGADINSSAPSGTSGSFPESYDTIKFRRLLTQSGGSLHQWGAVNSYGTSYSSQLSSFKTGATGTAIGDGVYLSYLISMSSGLNIAPGQLQSTTYWGDNLFLFQRNLSTQTNSYSVNRYWKAGTEGGTGHLEELPFVPSRDELVLILNANRGKGIFTEGEEFWSSSDADGTNAYSVTFHNNAVPTINTKAKTSTLKTLVCKFYNEGLVPVVQNPVITVEDI